MSRRLTVCFQGGQLMDFAIADDETIKHPDDLAWMTVSLFGGGLAFFDTRAALWFTVREEEAA